MLLKNICTLQNGKSFKSLGAGNVKLVGSTGCIGSVNKSLINGESIVVARVGANCGYVQYYNEPIWVSDNAIICKTNINNLCKYLYYYLKTKDINSLKTGGAQPLITSEIINSINLNVHDISTQHHIVDTIQFIFLIFQSFFYNSHMYFYH